MRILLVEDDEMIGESVMAGLEGEDNAVDWVRDGNSALLALNTHTYSIMILDLGLPGKDGLQVLRQMRARRDPTPVLVTTARDTVNDRIMGLDSGADDYLIKPYDLDELSARIRALVRRAAGRADPPVILSSKEYALLAALAERQGVVWSRAQLEEKLYNWDNGVGSNAIEVHIHHLRKKLSDSAIKTVRGVGYLLET